MNIGIVILNYLAYRDTINCVESFLKQDFGNNSFYIVIVDNASPNESYKVLKKTYDGNDRVDVIQCDKNLGFANGNNHGYYEIQKRFQPDFVITSNEDIILKNQGLIKWIMEQYEQYKFAVLGPSIYSVNGKFDQNPMENLSRNLNECRKVLLKTQLSIILTLIKKIIRYPLKNKVNGQSLIEQTTTTDYTLHGSFQIFSKNYFQYYKEPYDPSTFLYHEEDILKLRCDRYQLVMLFSPEYEVDHLQSVSTDLEGKNDYDRLLRRKKCWVQSLEIYCKMLKTQKS